MEGEQKGVLLLHDGTVINGKSIGKTGTAVGEICFNTGMTGYQEIYTDPSYYGQIIVNTTPHIGNYGVHKHEAEANHVMFAGLVCDAFTNQHSRQQAFGSLNSYLVANGITGIADVDTRKLVRHIRANGAMNALINTDGTEIEKLWHQLADAPNMASLELSSQVTTRHSYTYGPEDAAKTVAVLDLGVKRSILEGLAREGVRSRVFPADTGLAEILQTGPDGFLISNGPGDPSAMDYAVATVRAAQGTSLPLFGICLGHQVLALANGVPTYKMHHGHRGLNHPVKNLLTGRSEITSQNHGFAVGAEDLASNAHLELTHINLNDNTVEGIRHKNGTAFSVQYHPEAGPGPHDSAYLFAQFAQML